MRGLLPVALFTFALAILPASSALAQVPPANIPPLPKASGAKTPLLAAWTQFVNTTGFGKQAVRSIQARFVVMGDLGDCDGYVAAGPAGQMVAAGLRGHLQGFNPANEEGFTVTVCTADLPETWDEVRLENASAGLLTVYPSYKEAILPGPAIMSRKPPSGVVMADTGCRGKYGNPTKRFYQDCKADWPFPEIVTDAVSDDPAFVLHVGDYHYFFEDDDRYWHQDDGRDRFEYWLQEFLIPAQPLLMKAPWVLGRGNHERCEPHRWFGEGWHVLFSGVSLEGANGSLLRPCYDPDPSGNDWVVPSWAVDFGSKGDPWRVVVIDSNQPADARNGFLQAAALTEAHEGNSLWLSHYPPVKMIYYKPEPDYGNAGIKSDAADAMDCEAPYACRPRIVFTGHQHLYQRITWKDQAAAESLPQIVIAGHGGTRVDPNGLPGYAHGANANPSISCTQTFPGTLPGSGASFGFGAGEEAVLRTSSQNGYVAIQRNRQAPGDIGWTVTPKWIGTPPAFPNASVACDGKPIP